MVGDNGTFNEWRRLIVYQLEQLEKGQQLQKAVDDDEHEKLLQYLHKIDIKLEKLITEVNIRAGLIGGGVAMVVTTISGIIIGLILR